MAGVPRVRRGPGRTASRRGDALRLRHRRGARSTRCEPDVVVNCIGIIKQLKEANDPVLSHHPELALPAPAGRCSAQRAGARLVHISTDCVFSGRKGMYTEDDLPDADDLYGRTKLLGEVDRADCLTIRTSIIGRDFLKQSALLEWFLSNRGGRVRGYQERDLQRLRRRRCWRASSATCCRAATGLRGLYPGRQRTDQQVRSARACSGRPWGWTSRSSRTTIAPCDRSLSAARFVAATGYRIPHVGGDGRRAGGRPDPLRRVEAAPMLAA